MTKKKEPLTLNRGMASILGPIDCPPYVPCIVTRYLGPTNHRPSRIVATHASTKDRKAVSWEHEYGVSENHYHAACSLLHDLRQQGKMLDWQISSMTSVDDGGYIFTCKLTGSK